MRALVRRPASELTGQGVEPVMGSLADRRSLDALVAGADAVIHLAGAINAARPAGFAAANVAGTAMLADAAAATGAQPRFLLVSSLAARRPELSAYARTKREAEAELRRRAGRLDAVILRPPAIYGPSDRATLPLFRQLARGLILVPRNPAARFSLLFADDLADLLTRLAAGTGGPAEPLEPDDGRPGGYGWHDLAAIAARALDRRVRTLGVPRSLLWGPAALLEGAGRLLGRPPPLSRGKLAELYFPDWVCRPATAGALAGWAPRTTFETGCAVTVAWYRAEGWL